MFKGKLNIVFLVGNLTVDVALGFKEPRWLLSGLIHGRKQHRLQAMPSDPEMSAAPQWEGGTELTGTAVATFNSRTTDFWPPMCEGYDGDPDSAPALTELVI